MLLNPKPLNEANQKKLSALGIKFINKNDEIQFPTATEGGYKLTVDPDSITCNVTPANGAKLPAGTIIYGFTDLKVNFESTSNNKTMCILTAPFSEKDIPISFPMVLTPGFKGRVGIRYMLGEPTTLKTAASQLASSYVELFIGKESL